MGGPTQLCKSRALKPYLYAGAINLHLAHFVSTYDAALGTETQTIRSKYLSSHK